MPYENTYTVDTFIETYQNRLPTEQLILLKAVGTYFNTYEAPIPEYMEQAIRKEYKNNEEKLQDALDEAQFDASSTDLYNGNGDIVQIEVEREKGGPTKPGLNPGSFNIIVPNENGDGLTRMPVAGIVGWEDR